MTKAARLQQFIRLVVDAGKQDDLSDQGICLLALDLDPQMMVLFAQGQFTITFSDHSRITFDQVPL